MEYTDLQKSKAKLWRKLLLFLLTICINSFYYQYEVIENKFGQTFKAEENLRLRSFDWFPEKSPLWDEWIKLTAGRFQQNVPFPAFYNQFIISLMYGINLTRVIISYTIVIIIVTLSDVAWYIFLKS